VRSSNWAVWGATLVVSAILLGCSSPSATLPASTAPGPTSVPSPSAPATTAPNEQGLHPEEGTGEAAQAPEAPTPTVRSGLHATDPNGVVLAAGRPTLVEFFAFW
jgi:hypothetical protein